MEPSAFHPDIDPEFLATLVCPVTRQSLRLATHEELAQLKMETALMRSDGQVAYPIRDGIPVLLPDAAIPLR